LGGKRGSETVFGTWDVLEEYAVLRILGESNKLDSAKKFSRQVAIISDDVLIAIIIAMKFFYHCLMKTPSKSGKIFHQSQKKSIRV
jgi:hypothetical protein